MEKVLFPFNFALIIAACFMGVVIACAFLKENGFKAGFATFLVLGGLTIGVFALHNTWVLLALVLTELFAMLQFYIAADNVH